MKTTLPSQFDADPLVGDDADRQVAGLNIAVAWPLPESVRAAYLDLAARVTAFDPGLYVYAYETTHVTLVTAINFKQYPDPSPDTVHLVESAAATLADFVVDAASDLAPFDLEISSPALARTVAFFSMLNPSGEIARLRERALDFCRRHGGILSNAAAPRTIHATFVRFRRPPRDALAFAAQFEAAARTSRVDRIHVDEILVTLETKPYMRAGHRAHRISLRRRPCP